MATLSQTEQIVNWSRDDILPDFQHLSPEASSLGEYGNVNFNHYTGSATVSIPLFSVSSGSLSLPISLSYATGGIKVSQEATQVGLGWSLSCGGCISRLVNGKEDQYDDGQFSAFTHDLIKSKIATMTSGVFSNLRPSRLHADNFMGLPFLDLSPDGMTPSQRQEWLDRIHIAQTLSQRYHVPDIYQASFCGHSLTFTLLAQDSVVMLSSDGHRYKVSSTGSFRSPVSFTITDDAGNRYLFDAKEYHGSDIGAYWLTEITSPKRETVRLSYITEQTESCSSLYESNAYYLSGVNNHPELLGLRQTYVSNQLHVKLCDKIVSANDSVLFTYTGRSDLNGGKTLTEVRCLSTVDGSLKHATTFHHGYFMPAETDGSLAADPSCGGQGMSVGTRLRLDSIMTDGRRYAFSYDSVPLPMKNSVAKDFWGYYNGIDNSGHILATPRYRISNGYIRDTHYRGDANRFASPLYGKAGSLVSITYPTGGKTVLEYEPHRFTDYASSYHFPTAQGSVSDRESTSAASYTGHYGTQMKTFTLPVKIVVTLTVSLHVSSPSTQSASVSIYCQGSGYSRSFTTSAARPQYEEVVVDTLEAGTYTLVAVATPSQVSGATSAAIGATFDIPHAAEESWGAGLRVSSVRHYDADGTSLLGGCDYTYGGGKLLMPVTTPEIISLTNNNSVIGIETVSSEPQEMPAVYLGRPTIGYDSVTERPVGDGAASIIHEYFNNYPQVYPYRYYYIGDVEKNGREMRQTVVSEDGDTLRQTAWHYSQARPEEYALFIRGMSATCSPTRAAEFQFDVYPRRDDWVYTTMSETKDYYGGQASAGTVTRLAYDTSTRQVSSVCNDYVTGCDSTVYLYPSPGTDDLLISRGMTGVPVGTMAYHKEAGSTFHLTGGTRRYFTLGPDSAVAVSSTEEYTYDGTPVRVMSVTSHAPHGQVRGYTLADGTKGTVLWSYANRHPVMRIDGASPADVAAAGVDMAALGATASPTRQQLISARQAVEASVPALVTLYIYDGKGRVTEIVTPDGLSAYYGYDSYGRLVSVRDSELKLLELIDYNYGH